MTYSITSWKSWRPYCPVASCDPRGWSCTEPSVSSRRYSRLGTASTLHRSCTEPQSRSAETDGSVEFRPESPEVEACPRTSVCDCTRLMHCTHLRFPTVVTVADQHKTNDRRCSRSGSILCILSILVKITSSVVFHPTTDSEMEHRDTVDEAPSTLRLSPLRSRVKWVLWGKKIHNHAVLFSSNDDDTALPKYRIQVLWTV